ncbi:hypothetical protein Q0P45_13960, partial [Staphylococcus aureus]|nr:hypothetical protein [Staphylococcus aureus]
RDAADPMAAMEKELAESAPAARGGAPAFVASSLKPAAQHEEAQDASGANPDAINIDDEEF